jgi:hypothetical protein
MFLAAAIRHHSDIPAPFFCHLGFQGFGEGLRGKHMSARAAGGQ